MKRCLLTIFEKTDATRHWLGMHPQSLTVTQSLPQSQAKLRTEKALLPCFCEQFISSFQGAMDVLR